MSANVTDKQLESIVSLNSIERYKHAIKQIADWEEAWGLYDNGWALAGDDDGNQYFLIWPAEKYAQICAKDEWLTYKAKKIEINHLLGELSDELKNNNTKLAIFLTPNDNAVIQSVDEFNKYIRFELEKYE